MNAKMNLHLKKMNTNMFRFDKFLEPVVVVSHTRKNYFNWALSDWAIRPTYGYWLLAHPVYLSLTTTSTTWWTAIHCHSKRYEYDQTNVAQYSPFLHLYQRADLLCHWTWICPATQLVQEKWCGIQYNTFLLGHASISKQVYLGTKNIKEHTSCWFRPIVGII